MALWEQETLLHHTSKLIGEGNLVNPLYSSVAISHQTMGYEHPITLPAYDNMSGMAYGIEVGGAVVVGGFPADFYGVTDFPVIITVEEDTAGDDAGIITQEQEGGTEEVVVSDDATDLTGGTSLNIDEVGIKSVITTGKRIVVEDVEGDPVQEVVVEEIEEVLQEEEDIQVDAPEEVEEEPEEVEEEPEEVEEESEEVEEEPEEVEEEPEEVEEEPEEVEEEPEEVEEEPEEVSWNVIQGTSHKDGLIGTADADSIQGYDGQDTLWGGDGDDVLVGGDGKDQLYGEAGNDSLYGGEDQDSLTGGAGEDSFIFDDTALDGKATTITDFNGGEDVIILLGMIYTGIQAGDASGDMLRYSYNNKKDITVVTSEDGDLEITLLGEHELNDDDIMFMAN